MARFDPHLALRTLEENRVRFVVIGGYAGLLHGSSALTRDTDICYQRSDENHRRLVAALKALEARLRVPGVDEELPFQLEAETIAAGGNFTFESTAGSLDVLAVPSGTNGYDDLVNAATDVDLGDGLMVKVASIDDLIRMKRASGRPKDQGHLMILEALADEIARSEDDRA